MSLAGTNEAIQVLLVEDNPGDVRLTREALRDAKTCNMVHAVTDGVEAMAFLHRLGRYSEAPRPDVILLDLNLPKKNGREVLDEIKTDQALRHIPVIVFTTSQAQEDVRESYRLRANAYVTKPVGLERFFKVVRAIEEFWFEVARLP